MSGPVNSRDICNTGANAPGACAIGGIGCDVNHVRNLMRRVNDLEDRVRAIEPPTCEEFEPLGGYCPECGVTANLCTVENIFTCPEGHRWKPYSGGNVLLA